MALSNALLLLLALVATFMYRAGMCADICFSIDPAACGSHAGCKLCHDVHRNPFCLPRTLSIGKDDTGNISCAPADAVPLSGSMARNDILDIPNEVPDAAAGSIPSISTAAVPRDCHDYPAMIACLQQGSGCVWCSTPYGMASCKTKDEAAYLPASVYNCTAPPGSLPAVHMGDCHAFSSMDTCLEEGSGACVWCATPYGMASCKTKAETQYLPPSVYICTTTPGSLAVPHTTPVRDTALGLHAHAAADCHAYQSMESCVDEGIGCVWCTSAYGMPECKTQEEAKFLPAMAFHCTSKPGIESLHVAATDKPTADSTSTAASQATHATDKPVADPITTSESAGAADEAMADGAIASQAVETVVSPTADCHAMSSMKACIGEGTGCVWCTTPYGMDSCKTQEEAKYLPPFAYNCTATKPTADPLSTITSQAAGATHTPMEGSTITSRAAGAMVNQHETAVGPAADCHALSSMESCMGEGTGCVWCTTPYGMASCKTQEEAKYLPPFAYDCTATKPTADAMSKTTSDAHIPRDCHAFDSMQPCVSSGTGCVWCATAYDMASCKPQEEAKHLPAHVYNCTTTAVTV